MSKRFVHLHCHTEYSLLDGAARIEALLKRAEELGMDALAITDHGVMYGTIDFYENAISLGIKPIIGCEFYVAPGTRFDRNTKEDNNHHLVLLAKNGTGYKNLISLATAAFIDGYYYKPRIDNEILANHSDGLIALTACLAGKVPSLVLSGNMDAAIREAGLLSDIFGKDNFFLELQDHGMPEQKQVNKALIEISKKAKMPLVATNDTHYVLKEDAKTQELLLCIQTGKTLADHNRMKFESDNFYLKSAGEMVELFKYVPDAINATLEIAEKCQLEIPLGQVLLPEFESPNGKPLEEYLRQRCFEEFKKRKLPDGYSDRLQHELTVINNKGFAAYFLIVADFVNFAKEKGIKVGPGRGSAAGSLVSYLLGITEVDPLKYNLLFERFLNPERFEMPDIDIDFEHERRQEVIQYVADKYGEEKVAQIITFTTMKARAAIRDSGRVLGYPYAKPDRIAKLINANDMTIQQALDQLPDFKQLYESDEEARSIIDSALGLEGIVRQDSIHAAGIVISKDKLTEYVPLQKKGGETLTQYSMDTVSKIGLLKIDLLGIKMLSVINKCLRFVEETSGKVIKLENIPMDDKKTFELLQSANTIGVFQLSESGMRSLLRELKPTTFTDIIALVALYRPGPLGSGMHLEFVERKHGRKKIEYPHPRLGAILKETYGIIVYQEQVMQIAAELAGFTMAEADTLRKAMGKKMPEVIQQLKKKFIEGTKRSRVEPRVAEKIFSLIEHFGEYGFNKSHSAAYGLLAYQTAYLKANFPSEYMAAIISVESKTKEKVQRYLQEARRMGIKVLPPDINESMSDFTVIENSLRFGLSAIRNVGDALVELIIKTRSGGKFKSLYDFCLRVGSKGSNKKALESLIKSGAMDSFGFSRKALLSGFAQVVEAANITLKESSAGQFSLFEEERANEPQIEIINTSEMDNRELLGFEKEMLGMYISNHPLFEVEDILEKKCDHHIADLPDMHDGSNVKVAGIINNLAIKNTRKGDRMAYLELEDLSGSAEVIVWPNLLEKSLELLQEDSIIVVSGRLDVKEKSEGSEVKIIASDVEPLDDAANTDKKVEYTKIEITLEEALCTPETLNKLKRAIKFYPGNSRVVLRVSNNGHKVSLTAGSDYLVSITRGFLNELLEFIPKECINLIRQDKQ